MTFGLSKLTLEEEALLGAAEEKNMTEEQRKPTPTGSEFEAASAALALEQLAEVEEGASSVTNEDPVVSVVIGESMRRSDVVRKSELISQLKELELDLRRNYPDPDRIVVPVSSRAVIHEDFRRKVAPIPEYVMFPRPALVRGKPLKDGVLEIPPIFNSRTGEVIAPAQELPIYVAAGPDGGPWRDSHGEYVVIDPQTGAIRQRVKRQVTAPKRSWFRIKWSLVKAFFKKFRFDFKIIKRV